MLVQSIAKFPSNLVVSISHTCMKLFDQVFGQTGTEKVSVETQAVADHDLADTFSVPVDLHSAIAALKGRQPVRDRAPEFPSAHLFPISEEMAAEDLHREGLHETPEADTPQNLQAGEFVPGKGIFLGIWSPADGDGRSLNKTFDLFAAPHDLGLDEKGQGKKLTAAYNDAVKAVSQIGNLLGHKGAAYENESVLYEALKDGSYDGEWFLPTHDMLNGTDEKGTHVQNDNLYDHKNDGAFRGTYTTEMTLGDNAHEYWSCTRHPDSKYYVYSVPFSSGNGGWYYENREVFSARVVRAEPRP